MWKSILTALIAGLAVQGSALAQPVSSADVNIVSVTGALSARSFTCTAVINNQNDDDARDAKVIVLMPLQVNNVQGHVSGGTGTETCSSFPPRRRLPVRRVCDLQSRYAPTRSPWDS